MSLPTNQTDPNSFGVLGSFQVGVEISLVLIGVLFLQIFFYFEHYTNDRIGIKLMVWSILVAEITHSILVANGMYQLTINEYLTDTVVNQRHDLPATVNVAVLLSSYIDMVFESYCGYRIWVASRRWEVPILCWFLAFARFACNVAAVGLVSDKGLRKFVAEDEELTIAPFVAGLLLNLLIAVALTYYTFLGGGGIRKSQLTMRRLLMFTVESGSIACVLLLIMVVLVWNKGTRKSLTWIALDFIVTKLNSNSILITLNGRHTINATSDTYAKRPNHRLQPFSTPMGMGMGNINVAMTQMTHAEDSGPTGDRSSLTSQFEMNEICLVELSKKGAPK